MNLQKEFSGKIYYFKLDGTLYKGYSYLNGKVTSYFTSKKLELNDLKINSYITTQSQTCVTTSETYYWTDVIQDPYTPGGFIFTEYSFTVLTTTCIDTGNGGGGGGAYPPSTGGGTPTTPPQTNIPCPGDVVKSPQITSPGNSGKNGGRYGYTRNNGQSSHWGLDISAPVGSPFYSPQAGIVVDSRTSFAPNQYLKKSYGNFITVRYVNSNGGYYYLKFNHINSTNLQNGSTVSQGQLLGYSGRTGNAAGKGVEPHIHIGAYKQNDINSPKQPTNPEEFLGTKFDSFGNSISNSNPCN